jgi:hypothetical protein
MKRIKSIAKKDSDYRKLFAVILKSEYFSAAYTFREFVKEISNMNTKKTVLSLGKIGLGAITMAASTVFGGAAILAGGTILVGGVLAIVATMPAPGTILAITPILGPLIGLPAGALLGAGGAALYYGNKAGLALISSGINDISKNNVLESSPSPSPEVSKRLSDEKESLLQARVTSTPGRQVSFEGTRKNSHLKLFDHTASQRSLSQSAPESRRRYDMK